MPPPFPDNWHYCVFRILTESGCSSLMDGLCGMFLLPRTDCMPDYENIFCDKVGEYDIHEQLTHLSYNSQEGFWTLEQRPNSHGVDETLATLVCPNRFPDRTGQWQLVHNSFDGKGWIRLDRWTLQEYNNRMEMLSSSYDCRSLKIEEVSRGLQEMRLPT